MTYQWTIGTDRSDGGIVANGEISGETPSYTRGNRADLELAFWAEDGISEDHIVRYEKLREYGDYAGSMTVNKSINGVPNYSERVPADAPVDSLVLDFQPGSSHTSLPGFWGIVKRMSDPSRYPEDMAVLEVQVVVLAELSEYSTRSDVASDLEEVML